MFGLFGKKEVPSKDEAKEPVNGSANIIENQIQEEVKTDDVVLKSEEQIIDEQSVNLEQLPNEMATEESEISTEVINPIAEQKVESEMETLQRLFNDPTIIGYNDRSEQALVYANVLPYEYNPRLDSVLDVGCGIGDFYAYIEEVLEITNPQYTGIDYNPNMIGLAKKKFIDVADRFHHIDLFSTDDTFKRDWVIAVSAFNIAIQDDMDTYIKAAIDKMYSLANKGVAINCLSKLSGQADDYEGPFNAYDPEKLFKFALEKYGKVVVKHNYLSDVFTLIIYK